MYFTRILFFVTPSRNGNRYRIFDDCDISNRSIKLVAVTEYSDLRMYTKLCNYDKRQNDEFFLTNT